MKEKHKRKNEKNIVSNYRPISLLPLCGKMFEKMIYDNMYAHFFGNKLISDKQSGYRRNDSSSSYLSLMMVMRYELYFLILAAPLTEYGTKVSYLNSNKWVLRVMLSTF